MISIHTTTYENRRKYYIDNVVESIRTAHHEGKAKAAWSAINTLTGRRRSSFPNASSNTPRARKEEFVHFFSKAVNARPPASCEITLPRDTLLPSPEDFNCSRITLEELLPIARNLPAGKSSGPDEVAAEVLRIPSVAGKVLEIMNRVLDGGIPPEEWRKASIIPIPKKPGTTKIEEHRGISLMSCAAKLFNKVLLNRLQPIIDPFLRQEQNGFRPKRGTVQQILSLRRVAEEAIIHQDDLITIFVDFKKAFDSVSRDALPKVLKAYNVPPLLISACCSMYIDTCALVITSDGPTDLFTTSSGVLQGDTLAPFLFILVLDWVLRTPIPDDSGGFLLSRRRSKRYAERRLAFFQNSCPRNAYKAGVSGFQGRPLC